MTQDPSRRKWIQQLAIGSAVAFAAPAISLAQNFHHVKPAGLKGNIRHSVCRWTFAHLELEQLCAAAKDMGMVAIDLVGPKDWPILKQYGLDCSMCYTAGQNSLTKGLNDPTEHDRLIGEMEEVIPLMQKEGYKRLICFSGNRNGMDDETGLRNCERALKRVLPLAEKHGVTLVMELLNSKVDHADYMCDRTSWGVELCKRVGSQHFKLLYDIYHMQVDEGDVIRTIRENHAYIDHYHTAGVPGRNELNDNQELNYPAIMRAIVETGFKGYVAHEFIPTAKDKIASLRQAVHICDV